MKKLTTLLLAAGMVVAATAPASAVDVKASGFYRFTFENRSKGFKGTNEQANRQRLRLGLDFVASENLRGFTEFQMGTWDWGATADKHGDKNVQTRQAYIDWVVPSTPIKVRMGRMTVGLPNEAFGDNSAVSAGYGGRDGVIVNAKATDWLGVTGLWVRAAHTNGNDIHFQKNVDIFGLSADLKFTGFQITPWAAYAHQDRGSSSLDYDPATGVMTSENTWGDISVDIPNGKGEGSIDNRIAEVGDSDLSFNRSSDTYWFGLSTTMTYFDPLTVKLSATFGERKYGAADFDSITKMYGFNLGGDRSGWNVQALASYKLGFGTPIFGGWYGSGDDANEKYARAGWQPSVNGRFLPSMGYYDVAPYSLGGGVCNYNIAGTWGFQAGIESLSFLQDLSHDFKVTYIQGTNNTNMLHNANSRVTKDYKPYKYMTTSDSVVDITLASTYNIYKNLIASLELAYMINNFDDSKSMTDVRGKYNKDDWRVALNCNYKF